MIFKSLLGKVKGIPDSEKYLCKGNTEAPIRKRHLVLLQSIIDKNPTILESFDSKSYQQDTHNVINRLVRSVQYHARQYFKSIYDLLIGSWGKGDGKGLSLWGIYPQNRPDMLLASSSFIGFSFPTSVTCENNLEDPLIVLPPFENETATNKFIRLKYYDSERLELDKTTYQNALLSKE